MKKQRKIKRSHGASLALETLEPRRFLSSTISFAPHVDFAVGTSPVAIAAADFNGDGDEDLAVADAAADKVYVYFGNGAGAFSAGPVLPLSSAPVHMIVGDFNGDGKPDIAVTCTAGVGSTSTSVDVFLNTGLGTFTLGQITTVETGAVNGEDVALAAGDFNGDGHLDLAVTEFTDESVAILLGTGTGTFNAPVVYNVDGHPTAITEADFNNDGYPDLAVTDTLTDSSSGTTVTDNDVSLLIGGFGANFSAGPDIQLTSGGIPTSVASANLTGASTPGLVIGSSNGTASVFTNSSGTFAKSAQPGLAAGSTAVAVSDFDLDGDTDFVSADGGSSTSTSTNSVTVVQGTGGGAIGNESQFFTGAGPADVVVADFNNDGKPDIATANKAAGTVSILLNNTAIPLIATKITVTTPAASEPAGSAVSVTATLTSTSASILTDEQVPTGTVKFYDSSTLLSTVTLASAATQAIFSSGSLIVGVHHLRAVYTGDDAYSGSSSTSLTVTITPTATEGPDLIGTLVSSTLPAEVAPGEAGNISIRVTNQGNTPAIGAITDQLYLSLDALLDAGDTPVAVHGSLAHAAIHLQPDQSVVLTGSITIPQSAGLASYYFLTALNTTGSLAESVPTNNLVVSPGAVTVADVFGTVGGRKNVTLTVSGNNGTPAIFRLSGPGMGTVNVGDDGVDLLLDQTTAGSAVTVTTRGSAVFQLNDLSAGSAVRSITAPGASVSDAVTLPDGINSISLNSIGTANAAAAISIGTGTVTSITVGSVPAASLTSAGGIRSLTVGNWGSGIISAPWISSLRIKQNFAASLQISGIAAPGGVALGSVIIGGDIGDESWTVAGTIGRLSGAAFTAGWALNDTGLLNSISSAGAFAVTINAGSIGSIQARGSAVGATITATTRIRSISISGSVDVSTKFVAVMFPRKAILGGVAVDPATDSHFTVT